MAEKKSFPNIPVTHWLGLREKFKKSIPGAITSNYIASVLGMTEISAKSNVLPSLRLIGMIDDNGTTNQEMAVKFRDDEGYKKLCAEILKAVYPSEVREAFPDTESDKESIKKWFMNHTGVGSSGASRIVSFYVALLEADPQPDITNKKSNNQSKTPKSPAPPKKSEAKSTVKSENEKGIAPTLPDSHIKAPDLNINVQIHISADATPDQIEKIFESMSKHLFKNK